MPRSGELSASSSSFPRRCSRRSAQRTSAGTDAVGRACSRASRCRSRRGSRRSPSSSRSRTAWGASRRLGSSPVERRGEQFDPRLADLVNAEADAILSGLDSVATWDAVIEAEPALAVVLSGERLRLGSAGDRELRRPQVAVLPRPRSRGRRPRRRGRRAARAGRSRRADAAPRRTGPRSRPARGVERDLGQARPARRRRMGAGASPPVPDRADAAPVAGARAPCGNRRPAPRTPRRLGLPARSLRSRDLTAGPHPRGRGRLPGDAGAASAPPGAVSRRGRRGAEGRGQGRPARRRGGRSGSRRRRPSRPAAPGGPGGTDASARSRFCGCSRAGSPTRRSPRAS